MSLVDNDALQAIITKRYGARAGAVDDAYTRFIIEAASDLVRETAGMPGWVAETPGPGQSRAPARARQIATLVAARAWGDSGNLQTRASGPVRETYFENGIRGLVLDQGDRDWLEGHKGGTGNGMWILRVGAGRRRTHGSIVKGDNIFAPGGELMAGPDMDYAYGLDLEP